MPAPENSLPVGEMIEARANALIQKGFHLPMTYEESVAAGKEVRKLQLMEQAKAAQLMRAEAVNVAAHMTTHGIKPNYRSTWLVGKPTATVDDKYPGDKATCDWPAHITHSGFALDENGKIYLYKAESTIVRSHSRPSTPPDDLPPTDATLSMTEASDESLIPINEMWQESVGVSPDMSDHPKVLKWREKLIDLAATEVATHNLKLDRSE